MNIVINLLVPLLAAFVGALLAYVWQTKTEFNRDKRAVFQTLMMYRSIGADELDWIKAMNVIDVVFHNQTKVIEAYRTFVALTHPSVFSNGQYIEAYNVLVHTIAEHSGYKGVQLSDIRNNYAPEALKLHYPNRIQAPLPEPIKEQV